MQKNILSEEEKDYTYGHKFLGTEIIDFCGLLITANIYKNKKRDESKTRFLVWFPEHRFCVMVWKDYTININDVSKTSDGKNWYSYSDHNVAKLLALATKELENSSVYSIEYKSAIKYAFAEKLFKKHQEFAITKPKKDKYE